MIKEQISVATCSRCSAYVFACIVDGTKVATNLAPLDADGYRRALLAGLGTYDQLEQAGRPYKLKRRTPASDWPPYDGRKVLADHACGTRAMNVEVVEVVTQAPKAPASGYTARTRPSAPVAGTRASTATLRRSEGVWRCERCRKIIQPGDTIWAIEVGARRWAMHDGGC